MSFHQVGQRPSQAGKYLLFLLLPACLSLAFVLPGWLSWTPWQIAVLVIAAWLPYLSTVSRSISHRDPWLALFFILVVAHIAHWLEHVAQMIQIHLLGMPARMANGIFGIFNVEWVHFLFNSWELLVICLLLLPFGANRWLVLLCLVAIWHEIEHMAIMFVYLRTHAPGAPGLLAHGGILWGGLPLTRPDLHFLYVSIEGVILLGAYLSESRSLARRRMVSLASPPMGI